MSQNKINELITGLEEVLKAYTDQDLEKILQEICCKLADGGHSEASALPLVAPIAVKVILIGVLLLYSEKAH